MRSAVAPRPVTKPDASGAAQQMVECPAGRRMSDDDDPRAVKGMREIVYERLNALDDLATAPMGG